MGRARRAIAYTLYYSCYPVAAATLAGVLAFVGGGFFFAYFMLGIRPDGIVHWSVNGTFSHDPPNKLPTYIELGDDSGLVPFVFVKSNSDPPDPDGWYELQPTPLFAESVPIDLGKPDTGDLSRLDLSFDGRELSLISSEITHTAGTTRELELQMFERSGTQYIITQEIRNGAVRPVSLKVVPDAMQVLGGAILTIVMYTILAIMPVLFIVIVTYYTTKLCKSVADSVLE
ncbi:MAG: hypothetical protein ED559_13695 [Phycisphaera sp.]|nr:MAG: hypothetical protein ED559_13695 [Phycisphaera sp.]